MYPATRTKRAPHPERRPIPGSEQRPHDLFVFGGGAPAPGARYRVESVAGAGDPIEEGWWCGRVAPGEQAPAATAFRLSAAIDPALSTDAGGADALEDAWRGSPWRVGLLLWWTEPAGAPTRLIPPAADLALRLARHPRLAERLLRRFYRPSARPDGGRDHLAYLEMQPGDVAPLRAALGERPRPGETQVWLTRRLG